MKKTLSYLAARLLLALAACLDAISLVCHWAANACFAIGFSLHRPRPIEDAQEC